MKQRQNLNPVVFLLLGLIILFASCANNEPVEACVHGHTYGFLYGLWHGIIAPINFIFMIFRNDITVYAPNNTGVWYALGFLIGSGGWGILGGKTLGRRRRRN